MDQEIYNGTALYRGIVLYVGIAKKFIKRFTRFQLFYNLSLR